MLPRFVFAILIWGLPTLAGAAPNCSTNLTAEELAGARFLHRRNPRLYKSVMVARGVKIASPGGSETRAEYRLALWLRAARLDPADAKATYYKAALTKRVSQSFFVLEDRIDVERGVDPKYRTQRDRDALERRALADQRESLEPWIEYFESDDSSSIEDWKKYWILASVLKLGPYDKLKNKFGERSRGAAAMFPELNHEALGLVVSEVSAKSKSPNFATLYARQLRAAHEKKFDRNATRGHWRRFKKGSDPHALIATIAGLNTGWCTAGYNTCRSQIGKGDFWIYFSVDDQGVERIPRLAIRMDDGRIEEVRGVGPKQELDEIIANGSVLTDKLREFGPDGERYLERVRDMKRMTEITKKVGAGLVLAKEELRFIYEIDRPVQSFGFGKDPRLAHVRAQRDPRRDLELIFEGIYAPAQISVTEDEALRGDVQYHHGSLAIREALREHQSLPRRISGILRIYWDLGRYDLPELPDRIDGGLEFPETTTIDRLTVRTSVGGDIELPKLKRWTSLELPEVMEGSLTLHSVQTLKNLRLPKRLATLRLTSIDVLLEGRLPEYVRNLFIGARVIGPAVIMPERIAEAFKAHRLHTVDGVQFSPYVGGEFAADYLQSAVGAVLPKYIGGKLRINGIVDLVAMDFSDVVADELEMLSLETCVDVTFPRVDHGRHKLPKLRSAVNCRNLPDPAP